MRKKLLSLLTVLCLVLGMLPATAMAVELTDEQKGALLEQGYTEEEIAELEAEDKVLVISEDTEIDEDYDGLILIVASCNVTIKGASIGVGVVILPGAADTTVTLTEAATVNAVVVLEENAEVVTEADTTVTYLTVAAPNAVVTIAGSVERYTLTVDAAGTESTISGSVETMTTDAPDTTTNVAEEGSVGEVNVGETATGTTINNDGTINTVNDEGGNATVNGNAPTSSEEEEEEEEEEVEEEEEEDEEEVDFDVYLPIQEETIADKVALGIIAAPLEDHGMNLEAAGHRHNSFTTTGNGADIANGLAASYDVTVAAAEAANTYDVIVTVTDVVAHGNANGSGGCWFGIAIPKVDGYTYAYAATTAQDGVTMPSTAVVAVPGAPTTPMFEGWEYDSLTFDTFYFGFPGGDVTTTGDYTYQYTVTLTPTDEEGNPIAEPAEEDVIEITLNVKINATAAKDSEGNLVWQDNYDTTFNKGTGPDDVPEEEEQQPTSVEDIDVVNDEVVNEAEA